MRTSIYIIALLVLPLVLGACSMHRQMVWGGAGSGEQGGADADRAVAARENPYQASRTRVPAAARQRFEQALLALEQADQAVAMTQLLYLAEHYPQLSGPALNLALLYQRNGELEPAERWFQQAVASNPANLAAYNQYGIFLREQGRFAEAEQAYLSALAVWEPDAVTHRNIGVLYDLYMGERERALEHFYRYQDLTDGRDPAVAGWIADLQRQLTLLVQGD